MSGVSRPASLPPAPNLYLFLHLHSITHPGFLLTLLIAVAGWFSAFIGRELAADFELCVQLGLQTHLIGQFTRVVCTIQQRLSQRQGVSNHEQGNLTRLTRQLTRSLHRTDQSQERSPGSAVGVGWFGELNAPLVSWFHHSLIRLARYRHLLAARHDHLGRSHARLRLGRSKSIPGERAVFKKVGLYERELTLNFRVDRFPFSWPSLLFSPCWASSECFAETDCSLSAAANLDTSAPASSQRHHISLLLAPDGCCLPSLT